MAMKGLGKNQELDSGALLRDARPLGVRFGEFLSKPEHTAVSMGLLGAGAVFAPGFWELFAITGGGLYLWYKNYDENKWRMPFRMPVWLRRKDPGELSPGSKKPSPASGICYIGNERINFPGSEGGQIWASNSDMRTHMLVFGTTGAGKAQPLDAKVHTPAGWRRMGDLKRGDVVSTPDGGVGRIDGVFPQGTIAIYRVVFEDGRSTEACANHLWEVQFRPDVDLSKPKGAPTGRALPKAINTQELIRRLAHERGRFVVPLPAPVAKPKASQPLDPYLLGYLLGDGEFTGRQPVLNTQDKEIVDYVRKVVPADVAVLPVRNRQGRYWLKWTKEEEAATKLHPLRVVFTLLGLDKATARSKFIPSIYLEGDIQQRRRLLQGLMDSNGAVLPKRGINFVCQSERLAKDVQELVRSLGGIASLKTRFDEVTPEGVNRTTVPVYQVSVRIADPGTIFTLPRLSEVAKNLPAPNGLILTKIEAVGSKEAQCIHIDHPGHLYITDQYVVTHNTEALTSIATNALSWASGFIYVDGKADSSLYAKIYAMCRKMGRDDDLLVINLMTGSMDPTQVHKIKMSNTMNPFSTGSADFLTQMVVSLMSESGGDNAMWKDRAISLVSGLMGALCYMRDHEGLLLNTGVIREYLNFPKLYTLYARRDEFPESIGKALSGYVKSLPGFQEKARGNQGEDTLKQHGFLEMQFTRIMGSLADTYGHIFMHELAEVDLEDVVLNNRILVVLLPSLEKSPDELRNLGNIVVAALRAMMAKTLGAKIEGDYGEVVEAKPTNAPSPYFAILDEYGYYAVKGAAVMFAQARGLGFSMVVAGQDRQALDKASKEEAGSIIANCKIKISMGLEDPTDTYDLFAKAAGESYVSQVSGFSANTGGPVVSYNDMGNASLEKRSRLTLQELKDLNPGEAVVMVGSQIIRSDMFYADVPKAKRGMRINRFLKVKPPSFDALTEQSNRLVQVIERLTGGVTPPPVAADDLSVIADHFRTQQASSYGVRERGIEAFMRYMEVNRRMAEGFASSLMEEDPVALSVDPFAAVNGAANPALEEISPNTLDGGVFDPARDRQRKFVRDVLHVDDEAGELTTRKRSMRAAIPDDGDFEERIAPVSPFDAPPAPPPIERVAPVAPTKVLDGLDEPVRSSDDVNFMGDMLDEFTKLFDGGTAVVGEQVVESVDEPAPAPAPAEVIVSEQSGRSLSDVAAEVGAGTHLSHDAGDAISTLAAAARYESVEDMREHFEGVEKAVGEHDNQTASINTDIAFQTLNEAIEEYPDKPMPPPANADSVLSLLEQLVDNYESRAEPIDGDEEGV